MAAAAMPLDDPLGGVQPDSVARETRGGMQALERLEQPLGRLHVEAGAGGAEFHLVPCLNEHPAWVKAAETLANESLRRQPVC